MRTHVIALVLCVAACGERSPAVPGSPPPPERPPVTSPDALRSLTVAPVVSACGTPGVDGVLSPGEWDAAVAFRFAAVRPESAGGGEVPATLRALSDGERLYFAFQLEQPTATFAQSYVIDLDADGSRSPSQGDDALVLSWWPDPWTAAGGISLFFDDFLWGCVVEGAPTLCGPADDDPFPMASPAAPPPGAHDGGGTFGFEATGTVVELWHPYAGTDLRDLRAAPGDVVPVSLSVRLLDACADYPRCYGDFGFPAAGYRDLVLGCGATPGETVVPVRIEVKPGDVLPTIHLSSGGTTAVAVLGSAELGVEEVDLATVFFAAAPVHAKVDGTPHADVADVDGDGRADLAMHFETSALRLVPGTTEATLAGRTLDGRAFKGTDVVRVVP